MMQVQRLVVGGETWPVRPEVKDATGEWEIFEHDLTLNGASCEGTLRCYVDIHECDGDPPSLWRVVDVAEETRTAFELDARTMTPEERASAPEEVREAGREILGDLIKDLVDDLIKDQEDYEK